MTKPIPFKVGLQLTPQLEIILVDGSRGVQLAGHIHPTHSARVLSDPRHLADANRRKYSGGSQREDPATCVHAQFLDKHFPYTGHCLDCGAEIVLGGDYRHTVPGEELFVQGTVQPSVELRREVHRDSIRAEGNTLTDTELRRHRDYHDAFWFGSAQQRFGLTKDGLRDQHT